MSEMLESLSFSGISNWVLLISSAILGTLFAYFRKWAWSTKDFPMLGTRKDRAKAITKLIGSLAVSLTVDMQTGMNTTAVIVLGIGIGLAVPVEVDKEEQKRLKDEELRRHAIERSKITTEEN